MPGSSWGTAMAWGEHRHRDVPPSWERLDRDALRAEQLRLLDDLAAFCAAHDLTWFLCAGSLLGAARHGGFIPWDDDVDVMLPRPDYERLRALLVEHPIPGARLLSAHDAEDYPFPFGKLAREGTRLLEPYDDPPVHGVNIDVFPVDAWPTGALRRRSRALALAGLRLAHEIKLVEHDPDRSRAKTVLIAVAKRLLRPLGRARLARLVEGVATRTRWGTSDLVGVAVFGYREQVPARCYESTAVLAFEGRELPAPSGWEEYLTVVYGDWRTPPRAELQRPIHAFEAYRTARGEA